MYKKVVILGLGNILMKDEGVGVHVAREVEKRELPDYVEIIDGGTASTDILASMGGVDKLIIIDALKGGEKPGTVYRLYPEDLPVPSESFVSLHQIDVLLGLSLARKTGSTPKETVIIGIEPKEIDWGIGLTPEIDKKIPGIVDNILGEIRNACYRTKTAN